MDDQLKALANRFRQIGQTDYRRIGRREALGDLFNFEELVPRATETAKLFIAAADQIQRGLPMQYLGPMSNIANEFETIMSQILAFSPTSGDVAQQRQGLLSQAEQTFYNAWTHLMPIAAFSRSRPELFGGLRQELEDQTKLIKQEAFAAVQKLQDLETQTQGVLASAREAAAQSGVTQQANHFDSEAKNHERFAKIWLICAVLVSLLFLGAAIALALPNLSLLPKAENLSEVIQNTSSKILILGGLAYLVIFCARNQQSHTHNSVLNRHRVNALKTFNALADAAVKEENRDIVLFHASSCIFSPQDSGFVKNPQVTDTPLSILQSLPRPTQNS
jgi:hypothetical protein